MNHNGSIDNIREEFGDSDVSRAQRSGNGWVVRLWTDWYDSCVVPPVPYSRLFFRCGRIGSPVFSNVAEYAEWNEGVSAGSREAT